MDIAGAGNPAEQELRRHFDKTETAVLKFTRLDRKVGKIIHGKAEAPRGKRGKVVVLTGPMARTAL